MKTGRRAAAAVLRPLFLYGEQGGGGGVPPAAGYKKVTKVNFSSLSKNKKMKKF